MIVTTVGSKVKGCVSSDISSSSKKIQSVVTSVVSSGDGSGDRYVPGNGISITGRVISVDVANAVESGNMQPVTSNAVKIAIDDSQDEALSNIEIENILSGFAE